jgi:nucleoid-associated protein YgaU
MPVSPFSRYRNLPLYEVAHPSRGVTRSLAIRRLPVSPLSVGVRRHRFAAYDTLDLLALKYFGREELYWHLIDANGGRLPDHFEPGEILMIPPLNTATRIERPQR